jgi:hypothetical protein
MTRRTSRSSRLLLFGAVCLPAALYLLYVWHYSFDLPFGDDWTKLPLAAAAQRGHLDFGLMWEQHTEARLLLPNLVFVGVGRLDDFNIRVMVVLSGLIFVASFVVLLRVARDYVGRPITWLPVLALGVAWFSLADTGNSLWAFQFAWYLAVFFLVVAVYFLLAWPYRRGVGLAFAIVAAVGGSLSMVQGFLIWAVGLLCILWSWERSRRLFVELGVWLAAALVTGAVYFFHYELGSGCTRGTHCSLTGPVEQPAHYTRFLFALVGYVIPKFGPIGREYVGIHQVVGVAILIGAGVVIGQSLLERGRGDLRPPLALALVAYGLLFDLMLVVTRGGVASVLASQSRFTMPNIVLIVGISLHAWAHLPSLLPAERGDRTARQGLRVAAFGALGVFLFAQAVFTTHSGIAEGRAWHRVQVTQARVLVNGLRIPRHTFPCYFSIYVTNGARRGRTSLRPVFQWVAIARHRRLYVFEPDRLAKYRALGPPTVENVCRLRGAGVWLPLMIASGTPPLPGEGHALSASSSS